jgi:HEAT repeat protein
MRRFFFLSLLFLISHWANTQQNPSQSIKRVQLVVNQNIENVGEIPLPFYDISYHLLKNANVEVVIDKSSDCDAVLEINVQGKPLWGYYRGNFLLFTPFQEEIPREGVYFEDEDKIETRDYEEIEKMPMPWSPPEVFNPAVKPFEPIDLLYTGAILKGEIILKGKDGKVVREGFQGLIEPDEYLSSRDFDKDPPSTPERAPFLLAFLEDGSFPDKLARMYYRCFGPYALASAILEKEDLLGGFYYQLLTPFLLEIRDSLSEPLCYLAVNSKGKDVRARAAAAFMELKAIRAIPILLSSLVQLGKLGLWEYIDNIWEAIIKLAKEKGGIEELLKCLRDKNYEVRVAVVELLGQIKGKEAVDGLLSALSDQNLAVRREAIKQLLLLQDRRAGEALINVLRNPYEDDEVRAMAAAALGEMKYFRALQPLKECLLGEISDELEVEIKESINELLCSTPSKEDIPELVKLLRSVVARGSFKEIEEISDLLMQAGPSVIQYFLPIIKNKKEMPHLRYVAFYILSAIKDRCLVKPCLEIAKDEKERSGIRAMAFAILGNLKAREASNLLISILTDVKRTENLRSGVALSLGEMGETRAIDPLYFALKLKPVKLTSKWEYDYYGSEYLSRIYGSGVGNLREASARALVMIGKPALERIKDALADNDPDVRKAMVNALAWKKDESLKGLLLPLKDDKNIEVKLAVARALIEYEDPQFLDIVLSILKDEKNKSFAKRGGNIIEFSFMEGGKA